MNEELKGILEKAYANGKTIDEVSAALKKNGYGDEDISFAGNFYNSKKKKPTSGESQSTQAQEPSFLESSIRQAQPEKAQGPSFLELPKYESAVSKATKPIISTSVADREFEPTTTKEPFLELPKYVSESTIQENAQVKREELSLSIADKLSAIKSSDDLAKLRPEIDEAYAKYKEFDLDGVAPTSLFNDDGSFNPSTTSFIESDIKSSMSRFANEQKKLAENSNFMSRGLDAMVAGVNGFLDMTIKNIPGPTGVNVASITGSTTFGEKAKTLQKEVALANYAEKFNLGYTNEEIQRGSMSMALEGRGGLLLIDMADQVVNLAVGAVGGGVGLVALGTTATGSAWTEVMDDNKYNQAEKLLYAVGSGLAEYATEKIFASDLKALRGMFGSAEEVAKMSRREFGDKLFGSLPAIARQPLEEGLEEAIVATTQEVMQLAFAGDKIDYKNIAESAFVGTAMGGSVGVLTNGPSAIGRIPIFGDRVEIRNKIDEINELIKDESISVEEKDLLNKRLTEYISKEKKIQAESEAYYSNFSEEDAAKTVKLNQTISDGIKNYSKLNSTEAKAQLASEVKTAVTEKTKIEQKYDSQAQQQVSSPVVEGQSPQQVQPVEGAGTQETQAGGIFQAPQEAKQAASGLGFKIKRLKVNQQTAGEALGYLNQFVSNISDDVFQTYETSRDNVNAGVQSIANVIDSFSKSGVDVNFIAHTTPESMQQQTGQLERGVHISYKEGKPSDIHVYIPSLLSNTTYHEAIHEIIPRTMGADGVNSLASKLKKAVKRDPQLQARMDKFLAGYDVTENTNDEFLTELASMVAAGDIDISIKRSIATKFMEAVKSVIGIAGIKTKPSTAQLFDGLNIMAQELGGGVKLSAELGSIDFDAARTQKITKTSDGAAMAGALVVAKNVNNKYPEAVEQEVVSAEKKENNGRQFVNYTVKQVPYRLEAGASEFFGTDAASTITAKVVEEVRANMTNEEVKNGLGWYSKMRDWFQKKFGANIEVFGQLLAATSARTPVDINFRQAVDAMRQFSLGKYDVLIESYHQYVKSIEKMTDDEALTATKYKKKTHTEKDVIDAKRKLINQFEEAPLQSNGKKFNANSSKVLQALYGNWLSQTQGPKTKNFAGNLTGRSLEATIDVWAARYLRRLIYKDNVERWRIHPSQEGAVEHTVNIKGELGGDYFFAEKVMRDAAKELGWQADDLQAFLWFLEKDVWEKNGWTGAQGKKKSSFEEEAAKLNTERYQAGVTTFKDLDTFNKAEFDKAKDELVKTIRSVDGVVVSRVNESEGEFYSTSGDVYTEPSFDVEFSVTQGTDVSSIEAKIVEIGKRYNQEAVLFSKIIESKTDKSSPIIEIGLKTPTKESKTLDEVKKMLSGLDVKGFTISRDSRGNILGIRTQFIQEFEGKPVSEGETIFDRAEKELNSKFGKNEDISYIERNFVETNVFFTSNEKQTELQSDSKDTPGGAVTGGLESASSVVRKQAGLGKPGQNGDSLDARRGADVKTSYVNTYRTSSFIHDAIREMIYSPANEFGFFVPRDSNITDVRGRKEVGDRDESRYFEADIKRSNRLNSVTTQYKLSFRIADHTVKLDDSRSSVYVEDGITISSDGKNIVFNIWSPITYNTAIKKLEGLFRVKMPKIDSQNLISNSRVFKQQKGIMEILRSYVMANAEMIDGKYVPSINEQDFVVMANKMGISDILARTLYADILDAGSVDNKKPKANIENIYKQYKDRIYQQPWYKELFKVKNIVNSLFDRQSNIKREITKANIEGAYDYLISKAGASARAKYSINKSDRKIFGRLNNKSIDFLNQIISLRRIVEVDQSFDDRRAVATENLVKAKSDMDYAQYRVDSMASNLSVPKKNELKKKLDSAKEEFNRIQKVVEESKRPLHTVDKKNNVSMDKEGALAELSRFSRELDNFKDLNNRADAYFVEFRSILDDVYKNGLITDELYNKIKDFDYSPTVFLSHAFDFGDNDVSIRDYGLTGDQIKAIKDGSNDDTIMDARYLLAIYSASASSRILKNRANKALYAAALDPDNVGWIRTESKTGEADKGYENVNFFVKGESTKFQLRTDLKREWDGANRLFEIGPRATKYISYLSGSAALKLLATRANPLFIVRNFPRDFGHILFFTDIYDNQNIYFAGYNLFRDFRKGIKSFKSDDKYFQEYMEMGGGMDFLSTDGRPGSLVNNRKFFTKIVDKASSLGESSEIGFRIAVYKRLRDDATAEYNKKYGENPTGDALELIKVNAVSRARAIIDFSQGGNLTKGLELIKPYINSAFQGLRVSAEYIKNNPKKFASKFLQAQAGMLALAMSNAHFGDDDMEEVPDDIKLRYFIIMTGIKYTDDKGRLRRAYIKIAKPQQMVPFFALMDVANGYTLALITGNDKYSPSDDLLDYVTSSIKNAMPTGVALTEITSSIPVFNMIMTYSTNYDSFRERAVFMGDADNPILPMDEGINDPDVERFYKVVGKVYGESEELITGEKSGLSPIRLKASVEKVITSPSSSLFVGATYAILDILTSAVPLDNDMSTAEAGNAVGKVVDALADNGISITKSTWGGTNPDWKIYNQKEKLEQIDRESGSKRMKLKDSAKELGMEYISAKTETEKNAVIEKVKERVDEIKEDNVVDAMYYKDSFMTAAKKRAATQSTNEIIYSTDDQARAKKVYELYGDMTDQELLEVRSMIYNESGYRLGPKFKYEYDKLTK
jgi:hypothetical protein